MHLLGMKNSLALLFLFFFSAAGAQSLAGAKLYGFRQQVVGGKKPQQSVSENNGAISVANDPRKNTWLFLVAPAKTIVVPTEVYLDGKKYKVKAEKVVKTPVVFTDDAIPDEPKTTVMVPKTTQPVWRLTAGSVQAFRPTAALRKLFAQNEVVVGYTVKGKKYYTPLKQFAWIEPALMQ